MAKHIRLGGGMTHIVPLSKNNDRKFVVLLDGFVSPLVLEVSESAFARIENGNFDLELSWGLSNLIDTAIAKTKMMLPDEDALLAKKSVAVRERAVVRDATTIGTDETIEAFPIEAVARDMLTSFAYSIELDSVEAKCVARSELGEVILMRYRLMSDDNDLLMADDGDLTLSEQDKFNEMG